MTERKSLLFLYPVRQGMVGSWIGIFASNIYVFMHLSSQFNQNTRKDETIEILYVVSLFFPLCVSVLFESS